MIWVRINGVRILQLCVKAQARAFMDPTLPRIRILKSAGALRSSREGEAPNFEVSSANKSGESSRLLVIPPLGALLEVLDDAAVIGSGTVSGVSLADPCTIEVQG